MKKIVLGLLMMFININIVKAEPSAFFDTLEVANGVMNSKYSKYNDMYTVYLDDSEYNLVFNYMLEDEEAAIIIYGNDYIDGDGIVTLKVVSSDGLEQMEYHFNVYRYKDEEVFLDNDDVLKLEVEKNNTYHIESVVAIIAFILVLFVFYQFFLT
ncbi:MAG: hypothetical protein ACI31M_04360 [Bacilli bacterium]